MSKEVENAANKLLEAFVYNLLLYKMMEDLEDEEDEPNKETE